MHPLREGSAPGLEAPRIHGVFDPTSGGRVDPELEQTAEAPTSCPPPDEHAPWLFDQQMW
jgi:hypothetical protein